MTEREKEAREVAVQALDDVRRRQFIALLDGGLYSSLMSEMPGVYGLYLGALAALSSSYVRALEEVAEAARKELRYCEPCQGRASDYINDKGECMIYPHAKYRALLAKLDSLGKGDGNG